MFDPIITLIIVTGILALTTTITGVCAFMLSREVDSLSKRVEDLDRWRDKQRGFSIHA